MAQQRILQSIIDDHYSTLGLLDFREAATPQQSRQAYMILALKHHPDKCNPLNDSEPISEPEKQAKMEENLAKYKRIAAAYKVLRDPNRRRSYDYNRHRSQQHEEFRKFCNEVAAPFFPSYARWSVRKPVPELGDLRSSEEEVKRFYEFWFKYETKREMSDKRSQKEYVRRYVLQEVYPKDPRIKRVLLGSKS